MSRPWRCRGCLSVNVSYDRKCAACNKKRPKKRQPKHLAALRVPYEEYIALNGGEHCGVCLKPPKPGGRRLDRDHDHRTGKPRGLLCHRHNRLLGADLTPELLEAAADYLRRAAA